jgi:hypothetical protein
MKTFREFFGDKEKEENPQVQANNQKRALFKQRSKDVLNRVKEKTAIARQKGKEQIQHLRDLARNDMERMKEKRNQM